MNTNFNKRRKINTIPTVSAIRVNQPNKILSEKKRKRNGGNTNGNGNGPMYLAVTNAEMNRARKEIEGTVFSRLSYKLKHLPEYLKVATRNLIVSTIMDNPEILSLFLSAGTNRAAINRIIDNIYGYFFGV